ncbi:MAG: YIP1 family protein [Paracoccaceae bacterium]|nr:YIP1 family protein [Paracoccaceae bacterium]MDG2260434.1 YIP1 family protein [Paracoccaceae bacterium]
MSVTNDIVAAYRRPGKVMARHIQSGAGEDRALIFIMASCVVVFISNLPVISRTSYLEQVDMGPLLGASGLAWLFVAPLIFYILAFVLGVLLRILQCKASWFHIRLALFWTMMATTPLILLNGLVGGMIGPGPQQNIVGACWFAAFLWILFGSIKTACKAD